MATRSEQAMPGRRPTKANPHGFGVRGLALFKSFSAGLNMSASELVQLVEVCRIADRLEALNSLITGKSEAWSRLRLPKSEGGVISVVITDPLREARLEAVTLRQLLEALTPAGEPGGRINDAEEIQGDAVDDLAKRRTARRANAAGS